jgi:hypothetical protein
MVKYLSGIAILLTFSSCMKEKDICTTVLPKPELANTSMGVSTVQSYDTLNVLSPDPFGKYIWIDPTGLIYSGASIQAIDFYGNWSVIEHKGSCTSDTTKFSISPNFPGCGTGLDSFVIGGNGPLQMNSLSTYNNPVVHGYYLIRFQTGSGAILNIYFSNVPTMGYHNVVGGSSNGLTNRQCYMDFNGQYISSSGLVFVTINGATITIQFCDVVFYYGGNQFSANGYLVGS